MDDHILHQAEAEYDALQDAALSPPVSPGPDPDLGETQWDRFEIFMPAVQSLVNALGGYEEIETSPGKLETIYRPGDSVLAVLKDLKKLWRKDDTDDERTVARCMAKAGLMRELIALLVECTDRGEWGRKVALVACDLIAALTWPIDVQAELKEMDDEPDVITDYASLLRAQLEYKAMLLQNSKPLRCILALILPCLAKPRKDEKDDSIISLGLHIVRNLLAIRDAVASGGEVGEKEEFAVLQSTLIIQLHRLTFYKLVLTLASCADKVEFNVYNVLVLDILHLTFRSTKPKDLAQDQDRAPMEKLASLLEGEKKTKVAGRMTGASRHSRFGTTISVKSGDTRLVLHKQNAITENPGKMLDEIKKKRAGKVKRVDDLVRIVDLTPDALRVLQEVAGSFISSCFNTFFSSILRDIRMERSKVRETDNVRTLFLSRFFVEYLLVVRQKDAEKKQKEKEKGKDAQRGDAASGQDDKDGRALGLVAEMAEMDTVKWVVGRMRIVMDDKPPGWTELQACLDCFTQILLLIDAMSNSTEEEDLEVAEILQNQLYYNGDILESALQVIAGYKDQSVAYLDSVIHFAYVLLRMLEKYSKNKQFMFVRKRKAARAKRLAKGTQGQTQMQQPESSMPEEYDGEDEDIMPDREAPSYGEHVFTFKSFERRFADERVVNTLVTHLARFQEFDDPEQLKRVVGLMHRQIVKTQAEGLYFRVSCLHLFRQILDQQSSFPKGDSSRDLLHLINFVLRKFFKRIKEDPFVIVEALAAKSRGRWKDLSSYHDDEEDGMGGQRSRIRDKLANGPAELEFIKKKNLTWSQQMEVVMAMLFKAERHPWVEWIIDVLEVALAARQEVVLATDGLQAGPSVDDSDDEEGGVRRFGPSKEAIEKFAQHDLEVSPERQDIVNRDAHFRLMLKLLSFEHSEAEKVEEEKWFLPSRVLPADLTSSIGALRQYLLAPPSLEADSKTLLRKARRRVIREPSPSEDEFGNPIEKPPKPARKKKVAEMQQYKSAAFIMDSEDDEEADAAFFAREAALRREMMEMAEQQGHAMPRRKRKGKKGTRAKKSKEPEDTQLESEDDSDESEERATQDAGQGDVDMDSDTNMNGDGDDESDDQAASFRAPQRAISPLPRSVRPTQSSSPPPARKRGSSALIDSDEEDVNFSAATHAPKANGKMRRVIDSDSESE